MKLKLKHNDAYLYEGKTGYRKYLADVRSYILRRKARANINVPSVGDFVRYKDGTTKQIAIHLYDNNFQFGAGSGHISKNGYISVSGSMAERFDASKCQPTKKRIWANAWFSHAEHLTAGCAVYAQFPFKVWAIDELPKENFDGLTHVFIQTDDEKISSQDPYKYHISNGGFGKRLFKTKEGFDQWMKDYGCTIEKDWMHQNVIWVKKNAKDYCIWDVEQFERIRKANGFWDTYKNCNGTTLATSNGKALFYLNPNVKNRPMIERNKSIQNI